MVAPVCHAFISGLENTKGPRPPSGTAVYSAPMAKPHRFQTGPLFADCATQLARHSSPYRDPVARVNWELLSKDRYWLPEHALSLHGVAEFDALPLTVRRTLSQLEFAHFLNAGLWLESIFLQRLAREALKGPRDARIYHLHELREEAGHSLMFLEFFERAGLGDHCLPSKNDALLTLLGRWLPFQSTLFWSAIFLGEEVPDRLNRYIRLNAQGLCPVAVELSALHSTDEARHIAYGREILKQRVSLLGLTRRRLLAFLIEVLLKRFVKTFYYPPHTLYTQAGLPPGPWAARAQACDTRRLFVAHCLGPTVARLRHLGLPVAWP